MGEGGGSDLSEPPTGSRASGIRPMCFLSTNSASRCSKSRSWICSSSTQSRSSDTTMRPVLAES